MFCGSSIFDIRSYFIFNRTFTIPTLFVENYDFGFSFNVHLKPKAKSYFKWA